MRDNFDLQGYLRKNNKLLNESFEGFGGYRDLNPLNEIGLDDLSQDIAKMIAHVKDGEGSIDDDYIEQTWENISDIPFGSVQKQVIGALGKAGLLKSFNEDASLDNEAAYFAEADGEENAWMEDVDGTEEYTVGEWKCYYDYPGILTWSYSNIPFSRLSVTATPGFDGKDETPIQVDLDGDTVAQSKINKGVFSNFQEYAKAMEYALKKAEALHDSGKGGELEELEKPEKIYADDEDDMIDTNRMMDLGGQQIEQGIISLIDDGFEAEDILDMCKMFIEAHAEARSSGKKF